MDSTAIIVKLHFVHAAQRMESGTVGLDSHLEAPANEKFLSPDAEAHHKFETP
jgi:hypothetical protein